MAVQVRELIESRATQLGTGGKKSTTRVYQADTTPDLVAALPEIPEITDQLPWDSTQTCFSVVAMYEHGSLRTSRVIVSYSNDPTWGGNDPGDPFFKGWDQDYYRVAQPIPYAVEQNFGHRWMDNTGTQQGITTYPVGHTTFWESRRRFTRHVRIQGFNNSAWEPIGDMANTLMKIYNRWYLFLLGPIRQTAANVWDTEYMFEFDAGTPDVLNNNSSNNLLIQYPGAMAAVVPPGGFPQALTWARPPYHECSLQPGYNQQTGLPDWPLWLVTCPYEVNQNGWQQLPGFGPL